MINNSKLKIIIPFAMSTICLALSGCGGESATIHEDPNAGIKTASNGCDWESTQCQPFVVSYPVDGLNFDCSTDASNHFATKFETNVATGGCRIGDSVKFYIAGIDSNKRIDLGSVNLSELMPLKVSGQPVQISLMDIAKGMTGEKIEDQNTIDDTYKVLLGIIRILQDISKDEGVAQNASDIQPVKLDDFLKNQSSSSEAVKIKKDLDKLAANVAVADFIDGTYIADLAIWRNIDVSEAEAIAVATQLLNMKHAAVYSANFMAFSYGNNSVEGFNGTNTSDKLEKSIANLYSLTDRSGYSLGYVIQWIGKPNNPEGFGRLELITQVNPVKLNSNTDEADKSVVNWIDPWSDKITSPLKFYNPANNSETFDLKKQGQLFNQKTIPGNKFVYNQSTNTTNEPDSSTYGAWSQSKDGKTYSGAIDVFKTGTVTYLDGQVFKGNSLYKFPLFLDLTFSFDDETLKSQNVVLSIVIDKNGDIRSNLKDAIPLSSNSTANTYCLDVGTDYKTLGTSSVQQYRLGSVGTTNPDDNSLTLRMILASKAFGLLDGTLVGLNTDLQNSEGIFTTNMVYSSGVRLTLPKNNLSQLSIKDFATNSTRASWLNMFASAQGIYNEGYKANKNNVAPTNDQLELAKRVSGTISKIEMTKCS